LGPGAYAAMNILVGALNAHSCFSNR
jgi:hypothetical protein